MSIHANGRAVSPRRPESDSSKGPGRFIETALPGCGGPSSEEQSCQDYQAVAQFLSQLSARRPPLSSTPSSTPSTPELDALFQRWAGTDTEGFLACISRKRLREALAGSAAASALSARGPYRLEPELAITCEVIDPIRRGGVGSRGLPASLQVRYGVVPTAFGHSRLEFTDRGVCALHFIEDAENAEEPSQLPQEKLERDQPGAEAICRRMLQGTGAGTGEAIPIHLRGSPFELSVWLQLLQLPIGSVRSYQQIANELGRPQAVRAVASAIARNSIGFLVPCHRIIAASGAAGQYRWGAVRKLAMIGWESSRIRAT